MNCQIRGTLWGWQRTELNDVSRHRTRADAIRHAREIIREFTEGFKADALVDDTKTNHLIVGGRYVRVVVDLCEMFYTPDRSSVVRNDIVVTRYAS